MVHREPSAGHQVTESLTCVFRDQESFGRNNKIIRMLTVFVKDI